MSSEHFSPVTSRVNFPEIESEVLDFWNTSGIFEKSLDATIAQKAYVFYDGPPFATGLPHYGHLLAGTIKDIVPRFWTMRGNYVERRFGWDCHGLPVENEMEREFKVSGKKDIEKLGIHLFNEACRSIVLRYTSQWESVVKRMGRWVDFVKQYRTMDPSYMESIWWVFSEVWKKGLIYQGFRVQPYCPRCSTPLSNFEVNEGYKDITGPSITVSFPLVNDSTVKFLVWTTTPWTLPSNVALAVGPEIDYVRVKKGGETFILAKERLAAVFPENDSVEVVATVKGSELSGIKYVPMFDYFAGKDPKFFSVTVADFVSTEDGTGIVHIAPAFGEDDFQVGSKLGLPIVCPVDEEGKFTEEIPEWQGRLVYEADSEITAKIKESGRLIGRGSITHRYPHCYRCDTPLIYKAITTWFMKIDPLKQNMLDNNKNIHWVPQHLQTGRFGKGIESAPDWNISRNRYWGTPIPVWTCDTCGAQECIGSLEDLHRLIGNGDTSKGAGIHAQTVSDVADFIKSEAREKMSQAGIDTVWADRIENAHIDKNDIHRHIVDELPLVCPSCGSTAMRRTPEVLDCWFESGSMPYAQVHYPFENKEQFESSFPADFIAEGLDQTRGWFYTLTVLASALFSKPAFKNVIVNGIILSEDGKKLSKRLKNYAPPEVILNELGADALRLFLINSPAVKAEDLRFSEKGVLEMSRAVLLPFWNSYSFFVTYANVDGWKPARVAPPVDGTELDRWILSLLNHTVTAVTQEMENYNLYRVVPLLVDFIDNLTNWYIRRSRRRFWKSGSDHDKDTAYATLYFVLVEFTKVMSPFLPFLSESIYRNLVTRNISDAPQSVHLNSFPKARPELDRQDLEIKMHLVRQAVTMGRALRSRFVIKNRQPLNEFTIIVRDAAICTLLKDMEQLIREELNVKSVKFDTREDVVVTISAKANFKKLGKLFGQNMKAAAAEIEAFSIDQIRQLEKGAVLTVASREITFDDIEIRRVKREGVEVETEGELTVALDTILTDELKTEGIAREFVNRIQNLRKERQLQVSDRIVIFTTAQPELVKAIDLYKEYICVETLAVDLQILSVARTGMQTVEVEGFETSVDISVRESH